MAGKGDKPRPMDFRKYQENYELIFGNKDEDFFLGDIVYKGCVNERGAIRNAIGNAILDESSNIQTTTGES
jgi:hypothetical protein